MDRITRHTWGISLTLLFVLICGFCRPANASIFYVNKASTAAAPDGKTWATAFTTVQSAINAAVSGDEVWVAKGTYVEIITLASGVPLYGGFVGTETARTQRNWKTNATILDGGNDGASYDGVVQSKVKGTALDGFIVRNGFAGVETDWGFIDVSHCAISGQLAGAFIYYGGANISDCTISGSDEGVGLDGGTATITGCTISDNHYGVRVYNATATIASCTIIGSTIEGAYLVGGTMTVSNTSVSGNADGIYVYGTANIDNCTIVGNTSNGVNVYRGPAAVTNCIVVSNGCGIGQELGDPAVKASHCDVYGNTGNYGNVREEDGYSSNGNISVDPLFANQANGYYHLLANSPCINAGDDSAVVSGSTDRDGNPRIVGAHVDMGAYEYRSLAPWIATLNTSVSGGVTVAEKVAYACGGDGKVYARSTTDGSDVSGFPVDINAAVGATVKLPSRPAVYYGRTGKAIYLTTDRGDVLRVLPDGTVAWHIRPLTGQTASTPAVTPDGYVYVNLSTGSGPFNNYVFKLDEATGTPQSLSPFLGYTTADNIGDFSPAANGRYLYVNAGWGSGSGLTLLNQDNLAVRSSFAGGEQCLSPLLLGTDLLLASKGGKAWKMNAVTLAPDLGFGHFGVADLGSPISASPFSDAVGNVYVGTTDGHILKWTPGTGSFQPFYTANAKIAGLTIDRTAGVLGFGTSNGSFVQVPLSQPLSATTATPGGPISTGTVYDSLTDRFIVVTDTGLLSGYPAIR